jgi:hypothetical protein
MTAPTLSDLINACPEPVRRLIHDLETRCDPAGDVRARIVAEERVRQLTERLREAWFEGWRAAKEHSSAQDLAFQQAQIIGDDLHWEMVPVPPNPYPAPEGTGEKE